MSEQPPLKLVDDMRQMRDSKNLTGVVCPTKNMAVSPSGQFICFRRANRSLVLLNVDNGELCELSVDHIDVCHEMDHLFSVAFVDDDYLAVLLQDRESGKLFVCRARADPDHKRLDFVSAVADSKIKSRNGYSIDLIRDDGGMVLVSYPHRATANTSIELLPIGNSINDETIAKTLSIKTKTHLDGLWCDPFISRNCIYFFDQFEPQLLCISLSPEHKGNDRILNTYCDNKYGYPNSKFLNRTVQSFDDTVLVYFHQRVDKPNVKPQLWCLELSSLQWRRVQFSLSHHWPMSRVSFEKTAETIAYIHGECEVPGCAERAHLYQINLDENSSMEPVVAPITNLNYTLEIATNFKRGANAEAQQLQSPSMRYAQRRQQQRPQSLLSVASTSASLSSTSSAPSYVHWSQQTEKKLSQEPTMLADQLRKAKEMGYTDAQLTAALNLNQKEGQFQSFSSISAMVDLLHKVAELDLAEEEERRTNTRIIAPLSPQFAKSNTLQRLIDVFEKEKRGYQEESQRVITTLQARNVQLEDCNRMFLTRLKEKDEKLITANRRNEELSNSIFALADLQEKYAKVLEIDIAKSAEIQLLQNKVKQQAESLVNVERLKDSEAKLNQAIVQDLRVEIAKKHEQLKPISDSLRKAEMECEALRRKNADLAEAIERLHEPREEIRKLCDQIDQLKKEKNKYKDELEKVPFCVVCMERRPEMLFLPCSHFVCCAMCSPNLDKCPTCRSKLTGKCQAYQ
uniref:RING-type domain-containing protein n=1 Tax=Plectus sambesii TaxID=2011161 RepID=A0A914WZ08_9BILA